MESIEDIVREMRDLAAHRDWHNHTNQSNRERMLDFADCIEEAVTNCNQLKIRSALKYLRDASREFCHLILNSKYNGIYDKYKYPEVAKISDAIANAGVVLAEPPRNCDIGTAEEQMERYMNFCRNHPKCAGCPCVGRVKYNKCEFAWSQMPYEEVK
jgi:hypothetical protein